MPTEAEVKASAEVWNEESWESTIEDTKEQLAVMYLNLLDKQKWGILATWAGVGVNLNPLQKNAVEYLTKDAVKKEKTDIFSNILKNIKKKFVEKFSWWTFLEYDKKNLNKMKALITANKDNQAKLEELMAQIQDGIDPTLVAATATATTDQGTKPETQAEYDDKTNREKVLTSLNAVIAEDKKNPIEYYWWWRTDPEKWLDCSGLLYYTIDQAGLKMPGDSRSMFKSLDTKKLELKEWTHTVTTDVSDIHEGDVIFWNSTNPDYHRSTWTIPEIEKDGATYHIHHVAFIKKIDTDKWIVTVVESNGSQGVTESEIDIAKQLTGTDHKSELYVAHVDYDKYAPATHTIV